MDWTGFVKHELNRFVKHAFVNHGFANENEEFVNHSPAPRD